ncbi:hypothetical protein Pfo_025337 [Paulownia fortunei]|nr:hypothetical protein Pfo_025337 [Paulownia fortunei]
MEAFSLLKYWRTGGGGSGGATTSVLTADSTADARATTKTIVTAAAVSPYSSDGEDGPYFDLEFTLPDQESDIEGEPSAKSQENYRKAQKTENEDETESGSDAEEVSVHENDDDDEEGELKFALTSNECTDQNVILSPSDELFFKGNLVTIEPSSILLNGSSEENSKFPVFLVKSATKFRVLLLKLKKSKSTNGDNHEKAEKSEKDEANGQVSAAPRIEEKENQGKVSGKFFAVKLKFEEVPLVSLFTRDTSSKENHGKGLKHNVEDSDSNAASDERKLTKEVVQKYLKMVKPFYIRVSKRYVEKLKFSGHLSFPGGGSKGCAAAPAPPDTAAEKGGEGVAVAAPSNVKTHLKQGNNNLQAGLKVVRKHLGKSRSASAAVAAAPPGKMTSNRRDDSLLQLQDGIQGAILHCKKSFNASRDVESSSILCRSVSDPSYEKKSVIKPKVSWASSSSSSSSSSFSGEAKETKV